jgi:cytochrome c oxidase subunit 4
MHIWLRPTAVWVALVLLGLVSLGSAYLPLNVFNTLLNLAIAAIMVVLLWSFLMDLVGSAALLRLIAVAGLLWLSFMFALTFTDYLSRAWVVQGSEGSPVLRGDQKSDRGALEGRASPPRRRSPG